MKKIILSTTIVAFFVFYVIYYQIQTSKSLNIQTIYSPSNPAEIPVTAPKSTESNSPTPTPTSLKKTTTLLPSRTPISTPKGIYRDGIYTGPSTDAFYGNVQVQVTIQSGRILNIQFLDYPHDRGTSKEINSQAMPILISEVIQAQSPQGIQIVSGATDTSMAFIQSLTSALNSAKN
jgi:uncharacterized protein with FMN-binding domain